jgi:hypothetical protein
VDRIDLGGLEVSTQGLGCMGMSEWYGPGEWDALIATISRALELGVTFLDTANVYGDGHNEVLVGRAIAGRRDEVLWPPSSASTGPLAMTSGHPRGTGLRQAVVRVFAAGHCAGMIGSSRWATDGHQPDSGNVTVPHCGRCRPQCCRARAARRRHERRP